LIHGGKKSKYLGVFKLGWPAAAGFIKLLFQGLFQTIQHTNALKISVTEIVIRLIIDIAF
jgi:hypothetical protein